MRTSFLFLLVTSALLLFMAVRAEIPQMISYQGKVTDSGGTPVPDALYDMVFRIYDAATGGTALWNSGTLSVDVNGGVFSVLLGEETSIDLSFEDDYWLEVEIESDVQSPRQTLGSVGYAYVASGLVPGTAIEGAVTSGTLSAIRAANEATSGMLYGGYFRCESSEGRGVYGHASHTSGTTYGGHFRSISTSGTGVKGWALATIGQTYGVHGQSDSDEGRGVYGEAIAIAGTTYGGYFTSTSGSGRGVYGEAPEVGVEGYASTTTDDYSYGGWFKSASGRGSGVRGYATSTTGAYATYGVYGRSSASCDGSAGVFGRSSYDNNYGSTYGVYGRSDGFPALWYDPDPAPAGVYGYQSQVGDTDACCGYGGYFVSNAFAGQGVRGQGFIGVYGIASTTTGANKGIYGTTNSPSGYAGYFSGDVYVSGDINKSACSFLIDHPVDPENKLLRHNCVESPEYLLVYRGRVRLDSRGEVVVAMPEYFGGLADEVQATVTLTAVGKPFLTGYDWNDDGMSFTAYGDPGREVSWVVYADRDDPVVRELARPVEEDKGPDNKFCDRGELLHPTAYGHSKTMGRDYERTKNTRRRMVKERDTMENHGGQDEISLSGR